MIQDERKMWIMVVAEIISFLNLFTDKSIERFSELI